MKIFSTRCRFCNKDIISVKTASGKIMPCDPAEVDYQENKKGKSIIVTTAGAVIRGDVVTKNPASPLEKVIDGRGYISHYKTCENYKREGSK